jgi:hypothetical protein
MVLAIGAAVWVATLLSCGCDSACIRHSDCGDGLVCAAGGVCERAETMDAAVDAAVDGPMDAAVADDALTIAGEDAAPAPTD